MSQRYSHRELTEAIKRTIARFYAYTSPTAREVGDAVIIENEQMITEIGDDLAKQHIYTLVASYMKTSLTAAAPTKQMTLPMELRGVPDAISFPTETEIRFVTIARATGEQVLAYLAMLNEQIVNDTRSRNAVQKLYDMLADIFESHPGITVAAALRIYRDPDDDDDMPTVNA